MNLVTNVIQRHEELLYKKAREGSLSDYKEYYEIKNYEVKLADAIISEFGTTFAHKLGGILLAATEK